jgi:hypothetical protein
MSTAAKNREPNFGEFPPEIKRLITQIKDHGSDTLDDLQRMLVVQIFRTAAMTTEPRIIWIRNKIQEAHLEYCFQLPALRRSK